MIRVKSITRSLFHSVYTPYVLPFALFGIITVAGPMLEVSAGITYPLKTLLVGAALYLYRDAWWSEIRVTFDWLAVISGVLVFFIWVIPEGFYPQIESSRFNPYELAGGVWVPLLICVRMVGAALVVPLMEELFWRSFALRYLIKDDFKSLPLGAFSWFSFIVVSIAFGLEHHRWLVGIVAGVIYAGVLYRSRNLFTPILSHAITNFLLGVYVLYTHQWSFW